MNRVRNPIELPPDLDGDESAIDAANESLAKEMKDSAIVGVEFDEMTVMRTFLRKIGITINDITTIPRFNSEVITLIMGGLNPAFISHSFEDEYTKD
jgi:hypothetical protein